MSSVEGFDVLSADLGKAADKIRPFAHKAIEVTARNIKDEGASAAAGKNPKHARKYAPKIDYVFRDELTADVGPRLGGQGSLGGILEDGGIRNAPQNNLRDAMVANEEDFVRGIQKAGEDALG